MLISLHIENFAIVKQLELDFTSGMTTFTGETGAGKSIMIDALLLALGERADTSVIRPHEEKCDISACFQIDLNSEPARWLSQHEIPCEDGMIWLRRVIYSEGRSKSYLNGQPFPLQTIKELSQMLVHIHGQHQHQTLLQHPTHRELLDRYARHDDLLAPVNNLYKQCQKTKQELENLQKQILQNDKIHLLNFQIEELTALDASENEMQQLDSEHTLLQHAQDYLRCAQQIADHLNGDHELTMCQGLNQILQLLTRLPQENPAIRELIELINSAAIQCDEAFDTLTKFSEKVQLDPERLQVVATRMSALHQIARKYQLDPNQVPAYCHQLQQELARLQTAEHTISQLEQLYQQQNEHYQQAALALRASRQHFAAKLAAEITQTIQKLGMPKGYLEIELTPLETKQVHGIDKVEYKVCTNPGMAADNLAKIASGGELSRLSLAIQLCTAQQNTTPTLLFDEVDVGIGGGTAALVGQALRILGERLQLFCVTHQPQVAACAHQHFIVEKHSDNQQTYSSIKLLNTNEKINEIARMLGGLTITEQTRAHARELLVPAS